MRTSVVKNGLVMVVILLFVGVAVQPSVATIKPEKEINVEPKDFLLQTIIDIANNPEVKNLLEQHKYDLLKVDIDRSIYLKIFFRNPRLFSSLIFTKPSLSIEYLNKCYNKGIEVTNVLGEDKALEMIESVKVIDMKFFDALDNIISKDEKLFYRLSTIEKMNNDLKLEPPFMYRLIFCAYMILITIPLLIVFVPSFLLAGILGKIALNFPDFPYMFPKLFFTLATFCLIITVAFVVVAGMTIGCFLDPWEEEI